MFNRILSVVLLLLVVFSASSVAAQAEIVVPDNVSGYNTLTLIVAGLIIATVITAVLAAIAQRNLMALATGYKDLANSKLVQDEAERRYLQSSIGLKDLILLSKAGFTFIGNSNFLPGELDELVDETADFLDDITDGKPNVDEGASARSAPGTASTPS